MSTCNFCGRNVKADEPTTYREVTSWVHGEKLDGPVLRTQTGRLACEDCITRLIAGQAPDQESLL